MTSDGGDAGGQSGNDGGAAGGGGHAGAAAGAAGSAAGAAGSILPSGTGGIGGSGGAAGNGGAAGPAGAAGNGGAAGQAGGGGRGGATGGTTGTGGTGGSGAAAGNGGAAGQGASGGRGGATGGAGGSATGGAGGTATGGAGGTAAGGTMGAGGSGGSAGTTGTGGAAGQAGASGLSGLTLLAGGLGGPGNVDGIGAAARFNNPRGVFSDGAGNLYVADSGSSGIRKIVIATGSVTTIAAGAGSAVSVTGDGAGNLYVADGGHIITRVAIATGAVTTLAGNPNQSGATDGTGTSATFVGPSGIVYDGAGNLYVADTSRSDIASRTLVRKVVISTGTVTTLADEPGGYYDPSGITIDGAGNLYLAYNDAIVKIVPATGAVTTLAGMMGQGGNTDGTGTSARFSRPSGITADGAGNLYVADGGSGLIRKVVIATRAVTTIADAASIPPYDSTVGIAGDGAGNLYVTSADNTIKKVVLATGTVTAFAGAASQPGSTDATGAAARFDRPDSVASDGAGNLYVTDSTSSTIRKIVIATGAVTTFAGAAGQQDSVDGTGANARFLHPLGIVGDGAGNLYVADGIIRKIVIATGEVTTVTTGPGRNQYEPGPSGLALDGAGNLYFDEAGETIWKVAISTGTLTFVAGVAGAWGSMDGAGAVALFNGPSGLACDGAGNLYVADSYNNNVRKIVLATRAVTTLAGTAGQWGIVDGTGAAARFKMPSDIAYDGAGNLYVTDGGVIRKIALDSATVSTVIGSADRSGISLGALPASLSGTSGVVVLSTGVLGIVDSVENAVLLGRL